MKENHICDQHGNHGHGRVFICPSGKDSQEEENHSCKDSGKQGGENILAIGLQPVGDHNTQNNQNTVLLIGCARRP